MAEIRWDRYPRASELDVARMWLVLQNNLGLAPNTIDAYGRALEEYIAFSAAKEVPVITAARDHIASYVRDLTTRPHRRGAKVVVVDSGAGLANATLQQRITAIRLFYDYLMEEGLRSINPVGRGRYTPGKGFGGARDRGLISRFTKLPWIPNDEQWKTVLESARSESVRNRMMLALSYDSALRREELCGLETSDIDPAHRMITVRAETTKNRRGTRGALLSRDRRFARSLSAAPPRVEPGSRPSVPFANRAAIPAGRSRNGRGPRSWKTSRIVPVSRSSPRTPRGTCV